MAIHEMQETNIETWVNADLMHSTDDLIESEGFGEPSERECFQSWLWRAKVNL
jgi:hypothetical protein